MKGINKLVNEVTQDLSVVLLNEEYKAKLSNKLTKNLFLIKENNVIHFSDNFCRQYKDEPILILKIYEAIQHVKTMRVMCDE